MPAPSEPPDGPEVQGPERPDRTQDGADDARAAESVPPAADDAADEGDADFDLLARHGIDGVLARMGHDDAPVELPRRGGRSPALSLVVIAVGLYMLVTMWPDFRYWLRPDTPEDLGHVSEILVDGKMPPGLDNRYVRLRGTPDVQNAVRLETKKRFIGYRRIVEAGGSLFVAIPREKTETVTNTFEGVFEGRMRTLGEHGAYGWLEQFFEGERLVRVEDVAITSLVEFLHGKRVDLESPNGSVVPEPGDRLRIVVRLPVAVVQIGKKSVPKAADAEARVAALGRPYGVLDATRKPYHVFVVGAEPKEFDAIAAALESGIEVENRADPGQGVMVLPKIAAYLVDPAALHIEGDELVFPYGENKASPGFVETDGRLVEQVPEDGRLRVPVARVQAVRLERPIVLDPEGYVLLHGERPSSLRMHGILWLVVFGLVSVNTASFVLWWRRRRAAR